MNRKDTIIVSVLLNIAILSVLFVMAVNTDDAELHKDIAVKQKALEEKLPSRLPLNNQLLVDAEEHSSEKKFEFILSDLGMPDNEIILDDDWPLFTGKGETTVTTQYQDLSIEDSVEIIVKKGDTLERIAKANGTSIQSIRKLNGLKNDHLKIGQVLHVDVGSVKGVEDQRDNVPKIVPPKNQIASKGVAEYYTLKSGDSPWKVAKKFNVNMDELLRLNNLDEEKARNLKIGDKIRVQ